MIDKSSLSPGFVCLITLSLLVFAGCKETGGLGKTPRLKERSGTELLRILNNDRIEVEWVSAKTKLRVESDLGNIGFTSFLRMRTDSVIWFNIKKLGVEVSRGLITPDSFYLIDRLNRLYVKDAVEVIETEYGLPFTFQRLQSFILGNPDQYGGENITVAREKGQYRLTFESGRERHWLFLNGKTLALERQVLYDEMRDQTLTSDYVSYTQVLSDKKFALERFILIEMNGAETVNVEVTFNDIEFNVPKSMPFSIPDRYDRMDP